MARPSTIDPDQVRAMNARLFPATVAAARLGCTPRHYRRLCNRLGLPPTYAGPDVSIGTDDEHLHWRAERRFGRSYRAIARAYGVSHEHVRAALSTPLTLSTSLA